MRAFLYFLGAIVGTMLVVALVAYPVYSVAHAVNGDWPFARISTRLFQLLMVLSLIVVVRRLRLRSKADWGYGLPRPRFQRQFAIALIAGIVTMLPVAALLIAGDIRVLKPALDAGDVAGLIFAGLVTGLAVALLEETFFRGLMHGAIARDGGPLPAVVLTALVYAALHFLARTKIPHAEVGWWSGFAMLGQSWNRFAAPLTIIDSFLALFAVGVLLGLVRQWTGGIAATIGLHAGWVWIMKLTVGATSINAASPQAGLISRSDGFTGWLVFAWTVVVIVVLFAVRRRFAGWRIRYR
jgi:membrane protease YdiL (CAAX protease family)